MNARKTDGTQHRPASWVGFLALVGSLLLGAQGARAAVQYTEVYPPVTLEVTTGIRNEYSVVFRTADGDRTFVLSTERVVDLTVSPNTYRSDLDAAAATPGDGWVRFVDATSTDAELLLPADPVFTGSDPAGWDADRAGGSLAWVTGITSGNLYSGRARGGAFRGQDAYVGVGLPVSGGTAYGWIRVSADSLERSLTVYGYAFEETAGVDLSAGEGATNYPPLFTNAADVSVYDTFSSAGDSVGFVSATDGESVSDGVPITYSIVGGTGVGLFAIDPATGGITLTSAGAAALDSQTTPSYTLTVQADDGQPANNTATVILAVTVSPGIIYTPVDPPVTLNTTVAGQMYDVVFNTPARGPLTYTIRALAEDTPPDFWRQVGIYSSHGTVRVVGATEDSSRLDFGAWVADMGAASWSMFSPASEAGNLAWGSGGEGTIIDSGGNFLGWRGYIGVAISVGADGSPSFGWIEVSAADDASSVTIYGYAFAVPLFTDIRAGARGPAPANLPPVFTSGAVFSVSELATDDGTTLHDVQSNNGDGGAADAGITYGIVGGTGAALFAVDSASGAITLTAAGAAALDFETTPSYTLQVQADDGQAADNTATQTLTISVVDVAVSVTAGQAFTISEMAPNGTALGTVATTGDAPTTFSITGGDPGGTFAIDAAGQITVADATAIDYETATSFSLTVQAGDGTSTTNAAVTVNVADVGPTVTAGQSFGASEVAVNGTVVGSVATTGDAPTTFSITGGDPGSAFAINATGQITVADATALDFEITSSYSLTVQANDGTTSVSGSVTVSVTDVDPVVTLGQSFSVSESAPNGTVVGSVATTGDAPTGFSITAGNTGTAFAIDAAGQITVADASQLNFTTAPSYTLTVQAAAGVGSDSQTVTVDVLNVNSPPVVPSAAVFSVSELATDDGSTLHDVQANDGDGGAADAGITYSIAGGTGAALFAVDPASGAITLTAAGAAALDFEATPGYTLQIQADDGQASNNTATQTLTVTVTDAPTTVTSPQSFTVSETAADGAVVGAVATTGDTPTAFSITAGNTSGALAIDVTGQLTVADAAGLDFETTASYALTVQVGDGTTVTSETVTVAVTDVAPVVTPGQNLPVSEAAANGTVLGSVATTGDAATGFSITAGNTGGAFAIDAVGQITVADATVLDFETTAGYALTVQVGDGTTTATDTVTIDVTDVGLLVAAGQVFSVSEAAANGTVLGSVATTGDAATGFAITAGNIGGAFAIDAAGQITVADATVLDFETTPGYTLTVQASDGTNGDSQPLAVDVLDANEAPVVANPLPDQAATTGQGFSFTVPAGTFSDPDAGDSLILAATRADGSGLPAWLGFTAATGTFTGTPGSVDLGMIQVRVTATDGGGNTVSDTFQVTVADTTFAPTVTALPDQTTAEFQSVGPISFTVADADTPATSLAISATSADQVLLPDSGIILGGTGATRTLTLQPAPGLAGVVEVTVMVSDGVQTATETFVLTVTRVYPAPMLFDAWGGALVSGDAVSCDCGGVLALLATDGSGSFQLDVVSAPPGAGPSSVVADGAAFTFLASSQGAFAGEYLLSLTDGMTGRAIEVTYEVPLEIAADRSSLLDTDIGGTASVLGGAPGDVYSCTVLDVDGQPDLTGDLAVATASPATDDPAAGNPAVVAITPAVQLGVAVFRIRCESVSQPDLEPATTDLLRLVPTAIFAATVRDADGAPVAGARVSTRQLRDHQGEPYRATTDAAGWFDLALPAGSEAHAVFEVHAAGLAPTRVTGAELYLPEASSPVTDVQLTAPERTVTGTITGLASGEIAEVSGVYRDEDGKLRSTPAVPVTGAGSGADPFTLYLEARRYERFALRLDQRFAMAQDNQGSGYDLSGANTPSVAFVLGAERRYRGAELSPQGMTAAAVAFEETALATDLADHEAVAFDAQGVPVSAFSLTRAGNTLEAAFAEDTALRMALLDERGMVVSTVTHDPAGGIDAGPGGTAQVLVGGGARVRFTTPPDGESVEAGRYVQVELPPAGLDASGMACDPPPATVEVRTRQAMGTVGWAPLLTSATGNRSTQVDLHLGDCDGGLAAVSAAGGEVTLPPLVVTIPFDTQVVGPGDLESGRYRIYHAQNLVMFQAGEVKEVPPEEIVAVDLLNATVSFTVTQLSVFGVGPEGLSAADSPTAGADSGGGSSGCFLSSLRAGEPDGWWRRLTEWVGHRHGRR